MVIHIDYAAVGRILKEDMRKPVDEMGAKIAANLAADAEVQDDADGLVDVASYTTDRAIAVVRISHASGLALQAKYGVMTKAAAAEGLEVTAKNG